eukprot:TRINITY_DN111403_c0_g1_i1.p1 TRINITY_DN111403_c0_g1~~TRINITY_DN111403_c0_g1_i1.p1  ORF type:complete len:273 (-),score=48.50 TRINITY_DN111403_c0_g1_i1:123-941(-)
MPFGLDAHFYLYAAPLVAIESYFYAQAFTADLRTCQVYLGLVGLWWCFAALWVEVRIARAYPGSDLTQAYRATPQEYKAFCDFAPWASCSKVLMSPPGRFLLYFGITKKPSPEDGIVGKIRSTLEVPNPTLGVLFFAAHLFYPLLLVIPILGPYIPWLFFAACCFVGCMTCWLAYNLAFVLVDFCVVCVSMYVANFALIPMMFNFGMENKTSLSDFESFFGAVPTSVLHPFLVVDAIMGVAVLVLYMTSPGHAREPSSSVADEADIPYLRVA